MPYWPTDVAQKSAFIVVQGYYLVGSMTAWTGEEGLLLEPTDAFTFAGLVTLRHGWERFQVWVDGDPDRVLYPGSLEEVLGPESSVERWRSWRLEGEPGARYEIRLQVNGKYMQLTYRQVSLTPLTLRALPLSS